MHVSYNTMDSAATDTEKNASCNTPEKKSHDRAGMIYTINERPPVPVWIILAFQQCMMMLESTFAYPLLLQTALCVAGDGVGLAELISATTVTAGISTLLQSSVGTRLPMIQSASVAYLIPVSLLLNLEKSNCPYNNQANELSNSTVIPEPGSSGHREIWERNVREIQGSLILASIFPMLIGLSGAMRVLTRFIGPLTITPVLVLLSLSLVGPSVEKGSQQWYICFMTIALAILFCQYLRHIRFSLPGIETKIGIFEILSVLLSLSLSWLVCFILTEAGVFPSDSTKWGYKARTDIRASALREAHWVYVPYPFQFGTPTFSIAGVLGMLAAALCCCVESVGSYYGSARLSGAPAPPPSAVSRGIFVEGLSTLLSGLIGSCGGTVAYSSNVGVMGISKVGSRSVAQLAGLFLVCIGCLGKVSALLTTVPDPVMGGVFFIMFGMIGGVGLSNLQFVNLNSSRNMLILGFSFFLGLSLPQWVADNGGSIDTGSTDLNNIIIVLCGSEMFVGGAAAFLLDNTIPGTEEERGLIRWKKDQGDSDSHNQSTDLSVYDLPKIQPWVDSVSCFRYLPICPGSNADRAYARESGGQSLDVETSNLCHSD